MAIAARALADWAQAQREILSRHYDRAWQRGVSAYVPAPDPGSEDQVSADQQQQAGHGSLAAVLAARRRKYVPPPRPDPDRKRQAMAGASASIDKMVRQINDVATRAPEPLPGGSHDPVAESVDQWMASNEWRLMMGAGVLWAAEQTGFGQAADAGGELLRWDCAEDDASCEGCIEMAGMDPMPLEDWPSMPGDGGTDCGGNCRCTLDYVAPGVFG